MGSELESARTPLPGRAGRKAVLRMEADRFHSALLQCFKKAACIFAALLPGVQMSERLMPAFSDL